MEKKTGKASFDEPDFFSLAWGKLSAASAIPAFFAIIVGSNFFFTDAYLRTHVFERPLLLPVLNFIFLGLTSFWVCLLAAKSYYRIGRLNLALLGSGALAFGLTGISAGWFINLPNGVNTAVTIFNCGVLLAGLLHFSSSIIDILELAPEEDLGRRKHKLRATYSGTIFGVILIMTAALSGWMPVFFIQQIGPSMIRQYVLGSAVILLFFSGIYLLSLYFKFKTDFFFWYALGLMLIAEGLLGVSLDTAVGGIVGWTGRCAQYMGGIYLLFAILSTLKQRSFDEVLSEIFKSSKNLYTSMFENSLDGILLAVHDGPILSANPVACNLLGFDTEQLQQLTVTDIFEPNSADFQKSRSGLHTTEKARAELDLIRKNGSRFPVAISSAVFKDSRGEKLEILTFTDISERHRAEKALRESEEHLRAIFESTEEAIITLDMQQRCVKANPAVSVVTGISHDQVVGRVVREFIDPSFDVLPVWETFLETGRFHGEVPIRHIGGSLHLMEVVGVANIAPGRHLFVGHDITARKQVEEALRQLNETLEQRVAERTELAQDRAKQLRVLVSELTLAEQRERRRLAEILHDHLQQFLVAAKMNCDVLSANIGMDHKQTAENVLNLINQSIQTSRSLTAELSPPVLKQGSLSAALKWLARWMQESHSLTVDLKIDPDLDPQGEDIIVLLFQSIRELLFNAVKHAGVKSVRVEMARDGQNRLRVSVIDQGPGFDPDTIWEKAKAGTGFGLFSIRERLELLAGRLEFETSPRNGATFFLIVPLETKREGQVKGLEKIITEIITETQKTETCTDKIRVLLADDHTVVRQGLSTILNLHSDIEVIGDASNGVEAVKLARQLQPDVILMDINMPEMDGLEATRIIHSELPHIRIIGLSMHEKDEQAARMIEAGAFAYRSKSDNTDLLLAVIRGEID